MKKIKQILISSIKMKTCPYLPQLPSGSWRSYAQKFQLSPHRAFRTHAQNSLGVTCRRAHNNRLSVLGVLRIEENAVLL